MTAARILLVTGSRVLEGSESEAEARAKLVGIAALFAPTVVVAGDARGPDEWAIDWAVSSSIETRLYCLDTCVRTAAGRIVRWWSKREPPYPRSWPLERNETMVTEVTVQASQGAIVRVLGLVAEWSATKGTEHTLRCARSEGLSVTRLTFSSAKKLTT
jgi:hypothetical protein